LLLALLYVGCGQQESKAQAAGGSGSSPRPTPTAPEPAELDHGLSLDGVEKWQMDEHTRTVFTTMVDRFEGKSGNDPAIWKQTAADINDDITEFAKIFTGLAFGGSDYDFGSGQPSLRRAGGHAVRRQRCWRARRHEGGHPRRPAR